MITLYDFMGMDDNQKGESTFSTPCLGDREENGLIVQLYRIDEFYVEVFYDPIVNQITRFRPFNTTELLIPYIDISQGFIR
jgi:hypothetical protein